MKDIQEIIGRQDRQKGRNETEVRIEEQGFEKKTHKFMQQKPREQKAMRKD